ncbi:hypothetical protein F7725_020126 [Dissostichus mawsoni]|uniref:L1 transposable element RRM domain-containing protein n=1 Tax=Dissostichus mawsoni TaxID=36200 RepID=A0A7J5YFM6_DISMA|nr:hypothetical protein F7725_020126 [Dissostichus mawsoni]
MSEADGNSNLRETLRRTRSEAKKSHMAYPGASIEDGEGMLAEGDVASAVALMVTERISALMDQKCSELHSTVDRMSSHIEDNTKRITETESRISEAPRQSKRTISTNFAEITKIGTTLKTVASDVSIIKSDTTELKNAVNALQISLEEAEDRIGSLEDSTANMANESKRVEQLWNRVEDQENRGRRNNIKFIGLKEGKEAGSTINDYVKKVLNDGLGLQGAEYEIERSHRSGGPRPDDNQPPRMILVKFLRYTAQQKVLTAAKKNRGVRNKKEQNARTDSPELASNNLSMADIASLLEDHLCHLNSRSKARPNPSDCVGQTIASLESNANLQDERMLALEATCATLTDSNAKLLAKVTDLESRSRCNNIRIVGLQESIEGPHPSTFFPKLLMEVHGEGVLDSPPECDRAHRSLTDKPKPGQRPRLVIIRVHRRGKLQYQGTPIAIDEDYALEVMEQRYKYREVMAELYNLGLKPALLFPARLSIVSKEGGKKRFSSVAEAKGYIASILLGEHNGFRPPSLDSPYD